MERRAAFGVQIAVWGVVGSTTSQVIGAIIRDHYNGLLRRAESVGRLEELRASLIMRENIRAVVETACIALILAGLLAAWRGARARGALGLAIASAACLVAWSGLVLCFHVFEPDLSIETLQWVIHGRIIGVIAMWTGIAFAIPGLRDGATDLRSAGLVATLIVWSYGGALWSSLTERSEMAIAHPGWWLLVQECCLVAATTLLFLDSRRALQPEPAPEVGWAAPGRGLALAASGLVAQVIILAIALLLGFALVPWMLLSGLGDIAQVMFLVATMIACAVVIAGMLVAARTDSADTSSMAAASLAAFAIAAITRLQAWFPQTTMPDLILISGAANLLGVLFMIGYVHRVATHLGHRKLAMRAAGLNLAVLAVVGGSSLLAHAIASGRVSGFFAFVILAVAALVSAVMLLTVTKTAHTLAAVMRDGGTVPSAHARTKS